MSTFKITNVKTVNNLDPLTTITSNINLVIGDGTTLKKVTYN
jgi:hypothetical protein